ncbi:MAG: metallophosphoesterase [Oscillibacter sp.]|nr:metallophosphoesterase [Oscillibacter sp.]
MARRSRRRRGRGMVLLLALAVLTALFLRWNNRSLQVTAFFPAFQTLPEGFDGCRVVVLGDLHSTFFGEKNSLLLETVQEQRPEYIFLVGDLVDAFREIPPGYAAEAAAGLRAIAPVYYVTGNHEWAAGDVPELKETLEAQGVTVLSNEFVPLERGGDQIILAGIDDPNGYADQKTPETVAAEVYAAWGNPFWLLLAHRNNLFAERYSLLGAELVVSGHGHGGLVRLPFTDGLVSTERTFFPSYTAGMYEANGSALFVTRGLGNTGRTFRLFNRPEVAVITLRRG